MREAGFEAEIDDSDGTDTLRIAIDTMGEDDDGVVIMEVCKVLISETENGYYQFYTTVAQGIEEEQYPKSLVELNEINLSTVIGAYGILASHGMLYHKYIAKLVPADDKTTEDYLKDTIDDILAIIDNDYEELFGAIK